MELKNYLAEQLKGKRLHFSCNCLFPFDFVGVVKDYFIQNNEIVFNVDKDGKIIKIGENHPNLFIEDV